MARTSAAALKRKTLGLDPPKNEMRQANGRKGQAVRQGKDPNKVKAGKAAAGLPVGGRAALDQAAREMIEMAITTRNKQRQYGAWAINSACDLVPKALMTAAQIIENQEEAAKDRLAAAKFIFEVSGVQDLAKSGATLSDKPITEWTLGDLQAQVGRLEEELSTQVIDSTATLIDE